MVNFRVFWANFKEFFRKPTKKVFVTYFGFDPELPFSIKLKDLKIGFVRWLLEVLVDGSLMFLSLSWLLAFYFKLHIVLKVFWCVFGWGILVYTVTGLIERWRKK